MDKSKIKEVKKIYCARNKVKCKDIKQPFFSKMMDKLSKRRELKLH